MFYVCSGLLTLLTFVTVSVFFLFDACAITAISSLKKLAFDILMFTMNKEQIRSGPAFLSLLIFKKYFLSVLTILTFFL